MYKNFLLINNVVELVKRMELLKNILLLLYRPIDLSFLQKLLGRQILLFDICMIVFENNYSICWIHFL